MAGEPLAVEINDALLAVADGSGVLWTEPGYAVVEGGTARFGQDALRAARRNPHLASSRYWRDLSTAPIDRPGLAFPSNAALAAAQLRRLWERHGAERPGAIYAVPAWWTEEQHALLQSVSADLGIAVLGLADAAVAAASQAYPGRELLQLDAGLHGLTLTRIRQADRAALGERELFPTLGIEPLIRLSLEVLARRFVECTRYDPLHDAAAEQALFDRLPDWLPRFGRDTAEALELATGTGTVTATVEGAAFRARIGRACEPLLRKLRARVAERGAHALQVQPRLAEFPGLMEALLGLPDTEVHVLPPGAAALGLVGWVPAGPVPVVTELPWRADPGSRPRRLAPAPAAALPLPTHLLLGPRAYRLGDGPFRIGSDLAPGDAGVALNPATRGVSRQHCTLRRENGAWLVYDHSRFGTWLNGHRVEGAALVQPGDVLAVGSPPVELRLVAEVTAGGA